MIINGHIEDKTYIQCLLSFPNRSLYIWYQEQVHDWEVVGTQAVSVHGMLLSIATEMSITPIFTYYLHISNIMDRSHIMFNIFNNLLFADTLIEE